MARHVYTAFVSCSSLLLVLSFQGTLATGRQLLQSPTADEILTEMLCFADQASAAVDQFAGLTGGTTGLPLVINNLVETSDKLEGQIEDFLGIKPADACSVVPPAPTVDDAVKAIYCAVTNVDKSLDAALGLDLPAAQQTALQYDLAQLSDALDSVEAGLIEFLFNIKC